MWRESAEAIGLLSVIALPILISFCIVGSIIAALCAVNRGSCVESTKH
jgi:hypothetical protein